METENWIVGAEYDEVAFARLKRALNLLEYDVQSGWSGMAGSQDIQQWTAIGPSGRLLVQSETYIGLSVEGPAALVAALRLQYEQAG